MDELVLLLLLAQPSAMPSAGQSVVTLWVASIMLSVLQIGKGNLIKLIMKKMDNLPKVLVGEKNRLPFLLSQTWISAITTWVFPVFYLVESL